MSVSSLFFWLICGTLSDLIDQSDSNTALVTLNGHLFINFQLPFLNHYHRCHFVLDPGELMYGFSIMLGQWLLLHNDQLCSMIDLEIKAHSTLMLIFKQEINIH